MLSTKATAIFLITAIFNPLCCCLNLFAADLSAQPVPAEMHSCCSEAASGTEDQASSDHTQSECPHATEKHSQINETPDSHGSLAKNLQSSQSILYVLDVIVPTQQAETALASYADSPPSLPSSPLSKAYCVYIL